MLKIGHRGAAGHLAENTMESINKAVELGVDGVEIDIFKCFSGELILSHDSNLKRMTEKSGEIEELTLDEIRSYLIQNKYKIPTLKYVLQNLKPEIFINIELKGNDTSMLVYELLAEFIDLKIWESKNFIISSFNWNELESFRALSKEISVGVLVERQMDLNKAIDFAKKINAQSIHPYYKILNAKLVNKVQEDGFKVYTWTVNNIKDIKYIRSLKVDGIMSAFPEKI